MQPENMSSSDEAQVAEQDLTHSINETNITNKKKSSKPIMEKRRRARINSSLNELKSILLEALKKDSTRHSKLEKADILEMTVTYLKNVERQRLSMSLSIDPSIVDKYKAGFNECRNEVLRFLSTCEGVTVEVRTRLLSHLASCIRCIQSMQNQANVFDDNVFESMPMDHTIYSPASSLISTTIHDFSTCPILNPIGPNGITLRSNIHSESNNNVPSTVAFPAEIGLTQIKNTLETQLPRGEAGLLRPSDEIKCIKESSTIPKISPCKDINGNLKQFRLSCSYNLTDVNKLVPKPTECDRYNRNSTQLLTETSLDDNVDSAASVKVSTGKTLPVHQKKRLYKTSTLTNDNIAESSQNETFEHQDCLTCNQNSSDDSDSPVKRRKPNGYNVQGNLGKTEDRPTSIKDFFSALGTNYGGIEQSKRNQEILRHQDQSKEADYNIQIWSQNNTTNYISDIKKAERSACSNYDEDAFGNQTRVNHATSSNGLKKISPWRPWSDGKLV